MDDLDKIIMREIKNFVFEIAVNSNRDHEDYDMVTQRRRVADRGLSNSYSEIKGLKGVDFDKFRVTASKYGANLYGLYPILALSRDKKRYMHYKFFH